MTNDTQTREALVDVAIDAGLKFTSVFYDTFDKKRHIIKKLYHDAAHLLWDGNSISGHEKIQEFLVDLPGCFHKVLTVDSQPVAGQYTQGKQTILVSVSGNVKYDGNNLKGFVQEFMLISEDNVWKIISDALRFYNIS